MYQFIAREAPECRINEQYLSDFERQFELRLPPVLREYYLLYNGSQMHEVPFISKGYQFCAIEILTLKYGTTPVEALLIHQAAADEIPDSYVPFALDEDYDYYYWNKDSGHIVYISREDVDNPLPVCDDMNQFFAILEKVRKEG